ncbi:hypothetical protein KUV95_11850 [Microbulbifer agarilyticus]|uniref:hypothetical protein n=1 Tax=Microbulbifer agarilyticus TaxID=260552 RepID=UPI001C978C10|nr:hypothetical protein [Microbulbifer agarilyticus]MBY6212245.1 hypothetical protein [Microbulbifer agarilyticus]
MLSKLNKILRAVLNVKRISARFRPVAPFRYCTDVFLAFIRNLLQLLVFILPVKVLIIISSPDVPSFLENILPGLEREGWVIVLAGIMVGSYLTTILLDLYLEYSAKRYRLRFLREHKKERFANQNLLRNVYQRLVESGSGTLLLIVLSAAIGVVYFDFLIFFYVALAGLLVAFLSVALQFAKFSQSFLSDPSKCVGYLGGFHFILLFCYIVQDFLREVSAPGIFSAVVAVILSRRLLAAISQKVTDVVWFVRKKNEVVRLFYRGHQEALDTTTSGKQSIDVIMDVGVDRFARAAIEAVGTACRINMSSDFRCLDAPFPWVSLIDFSYSVEEGGEPQRVLVKAYERKRERAAREEQFMYASLQNAGLMPEFVGAAEVFGFPVHVFKLSKDWSFTRAKGDISAIRGHLLNLELDSEIVDQFTSEHPVLSERLGRSFTRRLELLLGQENINKFNHFVSCLPEFSNRVRETPLRIQIPDGTIRALTVINSGRPQLVGLDSWKIEPRGFGLSVSVRDDGVLLPYAEVTNADGEHLIPSINEYLVSKLAELEGFCAKKRFASVISIIDEICSESSFLHMDSNEQAEGEFPVVVDKVKA